MRFRYIITALLLLTTTALAQQQTPSEQALSERLLLEIQANVQARSMLIDVQRQLSTAQARIKELEDAQKGSK